MNHASEGPSGSRKSFYSLFTEGKGKRCLFFLKKEKRSMNEMKHFSQKRILALLLSAALLWMMTVTAVAAGGLEMSTDYPGITAKAGDDLTYSLDFYNGSGAGASVSLSASNLPEGWEGYFTGSGNTISRVYVRAGDNPSLATFNLKIPEDAAKGTYTVTLDAVGSGMSSSLELELVLDEIEVGEGGLTTQYAQQEGSADTSFTFSTTLTNNSALEQTYSLSANAPTGWMVSFKPSGESTQVAAITVDSRGSQALNVTVSPPVGIEAGEYTIPISAISSSETLSSELTVVITGSYELNLSTPSGRLSFDATANKESAITLSVTNNGNVDLQNINLTSSAPTDWTVTFSESSIDVLEAGATKEVTAYITPAKDAMSGDYVTVLTASNSETTDTAEFRVSVKTETIWGVVGILIIVAALCALGYVFRKYGRR